MKDFGRWLADQGVPAAPQAPGTYMATCIRCERSYELPCSPDEFNPDYSFCGGSPRCCP